MFCRWVKKPIAAGIRCAPRVLAAVSHEYNGQHRNLILVPAASKQLILSEISGPWYRNWIDVFFVLFMKS